MTLEVPQQVEGLPQADANFPSEIPGPGAVAVRQPVAKCRVRARLHGAFFAALAQDPETGWRPGDLAAVIDGGRG